MVKIIIVQGNMLRKGEGVGHPFRGNQYTDEGGVYAQGDRGAMDRINDRDIVEREILAPRRAAQAKGTLPLGHHVVEETKTGNIRILYGNKVPPGHTLLNSYGSWDEAIQAYPDHEED